MDWVLSYAVHRNLLVVRHYFVGWLYSLTLLTTHTCYPLTLLELPAIFSNERRVLCFMTLSCVLHGRRSTLWKINLCLLLANSFHSTQYRISNTMNTFAKVIYLPVWSGMLVMLSVTRCVPSTMKRAGSFLFFFSLLFCAFQDTHDTKTCIFCSQ